MNRTGRQKIPDMDRGRKKEDTEMSSITPMILLKKRKEEKGGKGMNKILKAILVFVIVVAIFLLCMGFMLIKF